MGDSVRRNDGNDRQEGGAGFFRDPRLCSVPQSPKYSLSQKSLASHAEKYGLQGGRAVKMTLSQEGDSPGWDFPEKRKDISVSLFQRNSQAHHCYSALVLHSPGNIIPLSREIQLGSPQNP